MLYENFYSYYSPYEEQELLRQMDLFDQPRLNSLNYSRHQKKSYTSSGSSVIDSSSPSSSSSSSAASSSTNQSESKKVTPSNLDTLSFCHTIYITINKGGTTPSSSSSVDYSHLSPEDCQLLLLPDICCTIPTSKWSSLTRDHIDWISLSFALIYHQLRFLSINTSASRLHHHDFRWAGERARAGERKMLSVLGPICAWRCVRVHFHRHLCVYARRWSWGDKYKHLPII